MHADPIKTAIFEDNQEITKKIHGMPPMFITSFQKYCFKSEEEMKKQANVNRYYLNDVTCNYTQRWPRIVLSRKELGLDFWWQ